MSSNEAHLYIHIPFCHSKCAYCDFYSVAIPAKHTPLAEAIANEYLLRKDELLAPPSTIYFGGGTPSILKPHLLAKTIEHVPTTNVGEFTVEVNPEDVTPDNIKAWLDIGINRVSMGVQSFNDDILRYMRRRHNASQAIHAYNMLRNAGIDNISLDLIYGLPGQSHQLFLDDIHTLVSLHPDHFSTYILGIESRTLFGLMLKQGKLAPCDDNIIEQMFFSLEDISNRAGYEHYELSNYALPTKKAVHNTAYWMGHEYLGLGPAAHSLTHNVRKINPADIRQYLQDIEKGDVAYTIENETDIEKTNDIIITRLRTNQGLDINELDAKFRPDFLKSANSLIQKGDLISRPDGTLVIPASKYLVSDSILRDLIIVD